MAMVGCLPFVITELKDLPRCWVCRALRGVLVSRAGRWLREAASVDPSGTTFNRMVDVMDQIVEEAATL